MKKTGSKTVTLTICDVEGEVTVDYVYYPGRPMSMYGGPDHLGWPEEPDEIELTALWFGTGKDRVEVSEHLTPEQVEAIEEAILEEGPDEQI